MNEIKPGYKTTEFWLSSVAALVGILVASGAVADGTPLAKVVALITTTLTAMGYSISRGIAKKE
jgi:hypothetical protein